MKPMPVRWGTALIAVLSSVAILAGVPGLVVAGPSKAPVAPVNSANGVALKGYDPVAYFSTGKPTPGSPDITEHWKGATYRFASEDHRELFKADPERYLPQYGGYCAYAMSLNRIADIDPARWKIVEGRLYLNNGRIAHTLWSIDVDGHIASADRNWPAYPKAIELQ